MREWNLKAGDPLSLTLAADARLGPADYFNDQIWEISLGGGEPPALAFQTTYGLRARNLRLFPRFSEGDLLRCDPSAFPSPPAVRKFYPNFIEITFSPFEEIEVTAEYWVLTSQSNAGRLTIFNNGNYSRQIRLELAAVLAPLPDGQRMAVAQIKDTRVLAGRSGGLEPVIILSGGAQVGIGPYPSLILELELPPGNSQLAIWSQAALESMEDSYDLARRAIATRWDAERARLELYNAGQVEIHTGNPDWDAAFSLSQKVAYSLFIGPTPHLPYPSFVITRQTDQGYSLRGDGREYNHLWNGQPALDAYYLTNLVLPAAPELIYGLLHNFLATADANGSIDWKPGLGGQRGQLLATPLLASLAEEVYQVTGDKAFLEEVLSGLIAYLRAWFAPQQDRDGDGIPEWSHPVQTGFEDHPLFAAWQPWAQGAEISSSEGPDLCAFLYQECQALIRMASLLERSEVTSGLVAMADHLRAAVEVAWNNERTTYYTWDRDSHYCTEGKLLVERDGPGDTTIQEEYEHPIRLLVHIRLHGESTRRPHLFVHGTSPSGQHFVERILNDRFHWYLGIGNATSEHIYQSLEKIEILGLDQEDRVTFRSVNYHSLNQTLLLPLWARIPSMERARLLVEKTICCPEWFWKPYGIPACADIQAETDVCHNVYIPWNVLIGKGLLDYGYRKEAAELLTRLMGAIVNTLKRESAFRRYYHSETGQGIGERNALDGLAPLGFFLDTLGVRLISPQKVALRGMNPFPWPVTVKYRGLTVLRQQEKTMVIFPDGQATTVTDPSPCIISLE